MKKTCKQDGTKHKFFRQHDEESEYIKGLHSKTRRMTMSIIVWQLTFQKKHETLNKSCSMA